MRMLKFRFWKDNVMQGKLELVPNGIIDMPWEWDTCDEFTGLLDKSGVEIYEGDVVKRAKIYRVIWLGFGWWLESATGASFPIGRNCINFPFLEGEVIGNIWENPEFIGGEQ